MHAARLPIFLTTLLLLGAGALMLMLGSILPLLIAMASMLLAGLVGQRTGGSSSAWLSATGAIAIFFSGTPLTGAPTEGLLITAVMAIYFICWVQQIKRMPVSAFSPTGPFTLVFYASLLLSFLLLQSQLFPLPSVLSILLATLFILVSLALWELGRRSRLTQAAQLQSPSLPDWIGRLLVLVAIVLATFLLFRLPLPWMANAALEIAEEMNLTADPPSPAKNSPGRNGDRPRDELSQNPPMPEPGGGNGADGGNGEGPEQGDSEPWSRGQLPKQADLNLGDDPRFHLEIPDEGQAKRILGRPLYLRAHTLSIFKDGAWSRADYAGGWITDEEDGKTDNWVTFSTSDANRVIQQRLYLYNHIRGGALLAINNVIAFRGDRVFRQSDDFFTVEEEGDISYELVSAPVHYDEVMRLQSVAPGEAPEHCLEKAQGLTFRDIDNYLLAPIQKPELTLKQKLTYIRRLFEENYTYSYQVENPGDHDPLANFLFHEKSGYCDFFAQAGAHLLRRLGVPTRVAYGYAGGVYDPGERLYTFRERDAHAWTEIFLKDHGWITFDLVPSGQGAHRPAETERASAHTSDPLRRFREAQAARSAPPETGAPGPRTPNTDWDGLFEGIWILRYLDVLLGFAILVLLGTYAIRRWRQRGSGPDSDREGHAGRQHREPPGYFRDFCELFAHFGHRRAPGQTLREYFGHLKQSRLFQNEFDPLLDYHYQVEYEDADRSRSIEKRFSKEIRDFRNRHRSDLRSSLKA